MEKIAIIDLALENEKNAIFIYLEVAKKTKDTSGKNMFITLASEETHHLLSLIELKEIYKTPLQKKTLEVPKSEIERILPYIKKREKTKHGKSELSELDALEIALEHEKKSMELYKELAQKTDDEAIKNLLLKLHDTEKAHYELVMAQIDYIKGTGFWFDIPEFSME